MSKKRVVIAGMGFGGLRAAEALSGSDVELIMVDRNIYHLFQPLLYQVATDRARKGSDSLSSTWLDPPLEGRFVPAR